MNREHILRRNKPAPVLHQHLVARFLGQVVSQLQVAQLQERTVLHEIGADTCLVVVVIGGQRRDIAVGIGGTPGVQHARSFVQVRYVHARPEVGLLLVVLGDHLHAAYALEEDSQVKTFVLKIEIRAERYGRYRRIDPGLVFLGDRAVAVQVAVTDTAQTGTLLISVVVDLLLALEDTVGYIAHLRAHRVTYH